MAKRIAIWRRMDKKDVTAEMRRMTAKHTPRRQLYETKNSKDSAILYHQIQHPIRQCNSFMDSPARIKTKHASSDARSSERMSRGFYGTPDRRIRHGVLSALLLLVLFWNDQWISGQVSPRAFKSWLLPQMMVGQFQRYSLRIIFSKADKNADVFLKEARFSPQSEP